MSETINFFDQLSIKDTNVVDNASKDLPSTNVTLPNTPTTPPTPPTNAGGKKAPSHGMTEEQMKKAALLLKSQVKDCTGSSTVDGMNGNTVALVSNKDSDFVIVLVNGQELPEYEIVHSVPKLVKLDSKGPMNKALENGDVKIHKYYLANKWNGMNIQIFKYKDASGQVMISAKPRATSFVLNDSKGATLEWVKSVLTSSPDLIKDLKENDDIQSKVFELCGSKVPHIVKYDFELDLKPLFTIRSKTGEIRPVIDDNNGKITECKETPISTNQLLSDMNKIKEELYQLNKDFRKQNNLKENMFWFNHFAVEGKVLYLLNEEGYLLQSKLIYSVKPYDTERFHWEQFDTELQSKILLIVHEIQEKGLPVNKDTLAKEMDLDEYSWNRHSNDILDLAILPSISAPSTPSNNKKQQPPPSTTTTPKKQSKILVTCGFPASGKSYFSQKLAESDSVSWKRINQDDLGTRKKCEELFKQYLKAGDDIVIDRCNQDILQRRNWLKIARQSGVGEIHLLWFKIDQQICKDRIVVRENHPTIPKGEEGIQIIDKFANMFTEPSPLEGYTSITTIQSEADSNELIVKYTSVPITTSTTD